MHEMIYWRVDGKDPNFHKRPLDVNTVNTWVNTWVNTFFFNNINDVNRVNTFSELSML